MEILSRRLGSNVSERSSKSKKALFEFKKQLVKRIKACKAYCKKHPKNYKSKKRGRKPVRLNERFLPKVFPNGDIHIELLTRSRYLLMKSWDKWSNSLKRRGELLFELHPKIEQAYNLIHSLWCIFRNKSLDRNNAKVKNVVPKQVFEKKTEAELGALYGS